MSRPGRNRIAATACGFLVLSFCACLLFVYAYPLPAVKNDAVGYLAAARSVAAGTGFTQDGVTPMVYRPPLFSGILGGWFRLTGTSSVLSAAVFQSILHALGVVAAFLLFLEISASLGWAVAGVLFLAVNPLLVTRVVFVLQEPTLLLVDHPGGPGIRPPCAVALPGAGGAGRGGLGSGDAGESGRLVRAVSPAGDAPPTGSPSVVLAGKGGRLSSSASPAVIAPWTIRNYVQFQRFIPVNGQGEGLLEWNVSHATIPGASTPGDLYVAEVYEKNLPSRRERTFSGNTSRAIRGTSWWKG